MQRDGQLLFPGINVNDSVTKSKFDNVYGCRHSLVDANMRATDVMISEARVLRFQEMLERAVWARSFLRQQSLSNRDRPNLCSPSLHVGLDVLTVEQAIERDFDIYVTATGNKDIITADHMSKMKDKAIVCNIGHFDNEIDMAGLEAMEERGEVERVRSSHRFMSGSSKQPVRVSSSWQRGVL